MFEVPIVPVVTKIFCAIRREHNCIISANESCVQERAVQWQRDLKSFLHSQSPLTLVIGCRFHFHTIFPISLESTLCFAPDISQYGHTV